MHFLLTILGSRGDVDHYKRLAVVALDNGRTFFCKELDRRTPYALTIDNCDAAGVLCGSNDPVLLDLDGELRFRQVWHEPSTSAPRDVLDAVQARMLRRHKDMLRMELRA